MYSTNDACASYRLTAESVRMVVSGDRMFFKSQTLTVRSSLPEITLSPPANTADVTCLSQTCHNNNTSNNNNYTCNLLIHI